MIKKKPIEEDIDDEEVPAYSTEVSAEAAAVVPIKSEEMFDWSGTKNGADDGISYQNLFGLDKRNKISVEVE